MAFEKLRTIVITAIPKPGSRERFSKTAETTQHQVVALQSRDGLVEGRSDNEASSVIRLGLTPPAHHWSRAL
jgi:hypothetical protein